jgi:hypothetical protein
MSTPAVRRIDHDGRVRMDTVCPTTVRSFRIVWRDQPASTAVVSRLIVTSPRREEDHETFARAGPSFAWTMRSAGALLIEPRAAGIATGLCRVRALVPQMDDGAGPLPSRAANR